LSINHNVQTYDLSKGEFPIQTLRPQARKSAVKEILWIYQMQSNKLSDLHDMGIKYWDEWDIGDGTIGCRYGATVKRHDLMNKLLKGLERDPFGRRHIMNMWQEDDFSDKTGGTDKGLNPCCYETIWNVRKGPDGKQYLDMLMNQRSSDYIVSNSINELQYVALQLMVAKHLGIEPGKFTHMAENVQIYDRHIEQAKELIQRQSVDCEPKLVLDVEDGTNFYNIKFEDFKMIDFPLDKIKEQNPQQQFDLGI
jgi:thymidylate synthase